MTPPLPIRGKAALRQLARDARDALPAAARADASLAIADTVDREVLAPLPIGAVVALYAGVASEVDTRAIADRAIARGLRVAYPRVVGVRQLAFALAAPDQLVAGTFRIPEPPLDAPAVAPADVAAFVVPGLAFDRAGARLGWGRGYYDATLALAPAALRVGVAFASQIVDAVPTEPTDQHVHLVITDAAVHDCRRASPGAP